MTVLCRGSTRDDCGSRTRLVARLSHCQWHTQAQAERHLPVLFPALATGLTFAHHPLKRYSKWIKPPTTTSLFCILSTNTFSRLALKSNQPSSFGDYQLLYGTSTRNRRLGQARVSKATNRLSRGSSIPFEVL